jgi:hypothetical protein
MKTKTLLIVYKEKDEAFFKQLKELIETKDDTSENTVGVEDGTVRVFKCSEKKWLQHKAKNTADKLADKTLFIDDIKDITLIHPIYNKYGISYGPIDKRHYAIIADEKFAWDEDAYADFHIELSRIIDDESLTEKDAFAGQAVAKKDMKKHGAIAALGLLFPVTVLVAGGLVAKNLSEAKKNADILRSQMLYFAIAKVYKEELDAFMKS